MAFSGQVLDNPISGERFIFHQTSDDTAGALLAFDLVVHPDGRVPGGHVHPVQQESFQVLRRPCGTAASADAPRRRQGRRHPSRPRPPAAVPAWDPRGGRPPARDRPAGLRDRGPPDRLTLTRR